MGRSSKYEAWLAESGHADHIHGMCHIEAWEAGQAELRAEVERLKKIQGNQARIIEGERQQIVDYDAEVERLRAEIEMLRKVIKSSPLW